MYCRECGNKLPAESKFCQKCGTSQDGQAPVQQPTPEAQQYAPPVQSAQPQREPTILPPTQAASPIHSSEPATGKKKSKKKLWLLIAGIIVAIILIATAIEFLTDSGGVTERPPSQVETPTTSPASVLTLEQVYAYNVDAVFLIRTERGTGSGFFVSSTGIAVTNHHVLVSATGAIAELEDGRQFQIVGYYNYDIENDLAVIQVDGGGESFQYVRIGDPEPRVLPRGSEVSAIGSPSGIRNVFSYGEMIRHHQTVFSFHSPYMIYTVMGIMEASAHIESGSSGGALFNDRGEVVGITSASNSMRPGISFSVPVNRVNLDNFTAGRFQPLPIALPGIIPEFVYAIPYQFVPTFGSISLNAEFIAGLSVDAEFEGTTVATYYEFVYGYNLDERFVGMEKTQYASALIDHGFMYQGEHEADGQWLTFFYHPMQDVSLLMSFHRHPNNMMMIVLGRGNAHQRIMNLDGAEGLPQAPQTYIRFPSIPDFGAVSASAILVREGFAFSDFDIQELRLRENLYITSNDYIFVYDLPEALLETVGGAYDDLLFAHGFELRRSTFYDEHNLQAVLYWNSDSNLYVAIIYHFDYQQIWVSIGV